MLTSVSAEASETFLPQSGLNSGSVCQLTGVCVVCGAVFSLPVVTNKVRVVFFLEAKCKL